MLRWDESKGQATFLWSISVELFSICRYSFLKYLDCCQAYSSLSNRLRVYFLLRSYSHSLLMYYTPCVRNRMIRQFTFNFGFLSFRLQSNLLATTAVRAMILFLYTHDDEIEGNSIDNIIIQ
jgi:hypothetical protein